MTDFTKKTTMTARLTVSDINNVYISSGSYAQITISFKDDSELNFNFSDANDSNLDVVNFIELLMNAALKIDWDERYSSGYARPNEKDLVTLDQVADWKRKDEQANDPSLIALREKLTGNTE